MSLCLLSTVRKVPIGKHRSRCSCHALYAVLTFSSLMWNSTAKRFSIWAVTRLPNLSCHAGITVAGTVGLSAYSVSYSRFYPVYSNRMNGCESSDRFIPTGLPKSTPFGKSEKNFLHSFLSFGYTYPITVKSKKQDTLTKMCRNREKRVTKYFVELFTKRCFPWVMLASI